MTDAEWAVALVREVAVAHFRSRRTSRSNDSGQAQSDQVRRRVVDICGRLNGSSERSGNGGAARNQALVRLRALGEPPYARGL